MIRKAAILIAALGSAACTHLETRPTGEVSSVAPGETSTSGAQRGLSYALPMVQYDLKITRALEECPTAVRPWPKFTAKVAAVQKYVAGERFEVDYQALSSIMKSTSFNVTYHDTGTLKSINSSAKDKTGAVAADVARIGLAIASVAMPGVAVPGLAAAGSLDVFSAIMDPNKALPPPQAPEGVLACTKPAEAAVAELVDATNRIKSLTRETAVLAQRITRVSDMVALKVMTADDLKEMAEVAKALLKKEEELNEAKDRLALAQENTSVSEELGWPNVANGADAHTGILLPGSASTEKLSSLFEVRRQDGTSRSLAEQQDVAVPCGLAIGRRPAAGCLAALTSLKAGLVPLAQNSMEKPRSSGFGNDLDALLQSQLRQTGSRRISGVVRPTEKKWAKGVFVREPVEARLVLCLPPGEPGQGGCGVPETTVLNDKAVVAPQLGRLRLLPFTNGPFEDNSLELVIRSNGLIETFKYGAESSASNASSNLATIAEKIDEKIEKMEEERRSDIKYARETQSWVRTEAAAVRADELAKLNTQVDETKKQLELLQAQASLSGAGSSIQLAAEQARLDAELKSLQTQVAKLKAANELALLSVPAS